MDNNYEPPCHKESDSQDKDEEEGEEEIPLPILDQTRINSPIPFLEQDLSERSSNSTRGSLERHLGTIIEETFREITDTGVTVTPELPPRVNLAQEEHPRALAPPPAQVDNRAEHQQNLLDGVVDTRTKLLNCFFFLIYILLLLHFLTYICFLCAL